MIVSTKLTTMLLLALVICVGGVKESKQHGVPADSAASGGVELLDPVDGILSLEGVGSQVYLEDGSGPHPVVSMCCEHNQLFNLSQLKCIDSDHDAIAHIAFYDHGVKLPPVNFFTKVGFPNCSLFALSPTTTGPADHFEITPSGELRVGQTPDASYVLTSELYCIMFPEPQLMEALACFPEQQPSDTDVTATIQREVYPIALLISSVFLLLTLAVYLIIRELRQETLAKCFMCSITMLALAQIFMVVGKWSAYSMVHTPSCYVVATLTHLCFLSAFLWLNAMSCTVVWSLWRPSPASSYSSSVISKRFTLFMWQCLYAFGVAIIITSVAIARDLSPSMEGSSLPRPSFAAYTCWFASTTSLLVYLIGPITVLIVINIICFCVALARMCFLNKRYQRQSAHFRQYMNLFAVTGVSWIFEVVSFFVTDIGAVQYLWIFFDMINMLQGVLIFVLFVCRRSVLRCLAKKVLSESCYDACYKATPEKEEAEAPPCNTVV